MRTLIRRSLFILAAAMLGGCSNMSAKPAPMATTETGKVAGMKTVMQAGGVNVLKLTTPTDMKCESGDGSLKFTGAQEFQIEYWLVVGAKSVEDAVPHVGTQIVSEFKDFKPDHTSDITIAGSPAKRLVGPGHEADDGDNGAADVIVFELGDRVFVACTHGESLDPIRQQEMLAITQTAQLP